MPCVKLIWYIWKLIHFIRQIFKHTCDRLRVWLCKFLVHRLLPVTSFYAWAGFHGAFRNCFFLLLLENFCPEVFISLKNKLAFTRCLNSNLYLCVTILFKWRMFKWKKNQKYLVVVVTKIMLAKYFNTMFYSKKGFCLLLRP